MKMTVQSFGQELMITDVDDTVAGMYECSAVNNLVNSSEPVSARFQLAVECKLFYCQLLLIRLKLLVE